MQLYLFRELLGAIRTKSALFFALSGLLLFLFLASVACLLVLVAPTVSTTPTEGQPIDEIHVFLSPRLSSATIDQWYLQWRERDDVAHLRFQFAQEFDPSASGGVFVVSPVDTDPTVADALAEEFRQIDGVTNVVEIPRQPTVEPSRIVFAVRIALLVTLVFAIAASLLCSRIGYRELLAGFSGEIRMLRLSGVSERILFTLVVALGVLIGLLGGLLLFAVLFLLHQLINSPDAFSLFGGLSNGARIVGAGVLSLVLGIVLGGLSGLLGASLLHRREFEPLP
jgi:hypothetical protein